MRFEFSWGSLGMSSHLLNWMSAGVVVTLLAWPLQSAADTISYADAITALAKDCGQDIRKHCPGVNLGNGRIQACLEEHQASVTPTCTSTLAAVTASIRVRQEAQASVHKLCAGAAAMHCKGVVGMNNVLGCLLKTQRIDGSKCNQAITDAGWRN
jgi:cysteine rich repeat protein